MELNQSFDYRIFDFLIEQHIRFALYRLPWQQDIHLILQTSQSVSQPKTLVELNSEKGFVISPFHIAESTPLILIRPDVDIKGEDAIFDYLALNTLAGNTSDINLHVQSSSSTFERYSSDYQTFHSALDNKQFQKLVLSRTFDLKRESKFSAGISFKYACEKYESNFIYLCCTPETGAWMGISPELLVARQGEEYKTVALAGTRAVSEDVWDEKNKDEQQIVVDYMLLQLDKIATDVSSKGPFTAQSGNIEHLKTKFNFRLKDSYKIGDLLDLLHPSPAVCGFPKKEAFDFIQANESYNRRYYSGLVGPLDMDGISRLYVNLRCMQIGADMLRLYAGGGILPSSELRSEWDETMKKLQTILTVIETEN